MDPIYVRNRRPALPRERAWEVVDALSESQHGALGRRQLTALGVPRWLVRRELKARRWQRHGRQVVITHNGPRARETLLRAALLTVGRRAALDGVTALQAAGISGLSDEEIHVITPKSSTPERSSGVTVHESRRFREEDVLDAEPRRTRPATAAVHAALWAQTDREASYLLILVVQQRLASVPELAEAVELVRRHPRRRLLATLLAELAGGVRSIGELDVARDFRQRGLPEPDRQVERRRSNGRIYLDVAIPAYGVRLELDGAGHDAPDQRLSDVLRDLRCLGADEPVIRVPMAAYRLGREQILEAVAEVLVARGWIDVQAA